MIKKEAAKKIVQSFSDKCGISTPAYEIQNKGGEEFLIIYVGEKSDIFLKSISDVTSELSDEYPFKNSTILWKQKIDNWLLSSEVEYLQGLISESLTIGKDSLQSEFYKKFIPFVGEEEKNIANKTNNVIFGRRGSGKSSLILYGCNKIKEKKLPFVWVAMQRYQGRKDTQVIPQFLYDLVEQCETYLDQGISDRLKKIIYQMEDIGPDLKFEDIKIKLPLFARYFLPFVKKRGALFVFIDDLHLLNKELQPLFLSAIYSIARSNNVYLKISAIENLTYLYDSESSEGMQSPGDIQIIRLDYNLVNPEKADEHIKKILNSYIQYAGIPSLYKICKPITQHRLIWVSAGVPRDALYIFNRSITKAINEDRKKIGITDINMSAADSLSEKDKFISDDVSDDPKDLRELIEEIRTFCVDTAGVNAFLVPVDSKNKKYQLIQKLIDLRFLHILHPGLTPSAKNKKYEALLLDYAFYTGFRMTSSIKEFKKIPQKSKAKDLRNLKTFKMT